MHTYAAPKRWAKWLTRLMREPITFLLAIAVSQLAAATVTFHKDVEPVLQKHCQGCHRPGEAAPFSLLQYKEARPWAKSIREAVQLRKMPPWFADPAHGNFANDRRLSPADIDTIKAWVDQGAPEGNPADAPPPVPFIDDWKIGKPDLVVELPVTFPVPCRRQDRLHLVRRGHEADRRQVDREDRGKAHVTQRWFITLWCLRAPPGSNFKADLKPGTYQARPEVRKANTKPQTDSAMLRNQAMDSAKA